MCSMSNRANGLSGPRGRADRYASSASARPGSTRAKVVSAYASPVRSPRSEMRLNIAQEPLPLGLELRRRQRAAQRREALAHGQRADDLARRVLGVRAVVG